MKKLISYLNFNMICKVSMISAFAGIILYIAVTLITEAIIGRCDLYYTICGTASVATIYLMTSMFIICIVSALCQEYKNKQ